MANFKRVIGQIDAIQRLKALVKENRVPHAILFCGEKGVGKMALAMDFACYLLSEGMQKSNTILNADTHIEAMLSKWEHPDLHFTYPTIKDASMGAEHQPISYDYIKEWRKMILQGSYFTIQQWMDHIKATNQQAIITGAEADELTRKLSLKSSQGGFKVSIIWLPERMNQTSANKMLKLLEEPPSGTIFLLVSEEPDQILETIRSRTQRIDIKRIDDVTIEHSLIEQRGIDKDMARRIAHLANGSWLKALETINTDNENKEFLKQFQVLMRLAYLRNLKELKTWSDNISMYGREKQRRMLYYFMQQIRENFMYNFSQPELIYLTMEEENFAKNFSRFINEANIIEINELLELAYRDIRQNANAKIVFYDLALKMILLILKK
ncbi:ATP-binding protein [Prevotella amnii]|uniref:DNA polymerase III subunit n=1 Tax=Prevotella amnii TaxID=419005 RepID=UPI00035F1147|nr:DNA polymerase III subunit delta [Prevotella amnii]